jgi:hypothetical protein
MRTSYRPSQLPISWIGVGWTDDSLQRQLKDADDYRGTPWIGV